MSAPAQPGKASGLSLEEIGKLLALVRNSPFNEVEIEWGDVKLRVRQKTPGLFGDLQFPDVRVEQRPR